MSGQFCDDPDCQRCQHLGIGHVPPAAPELPERELLAITIAGWKVTMLAVREALSTQGLSIVDAKDRAVLEAWSEVPLEWVQLWARDSYGWLTRISLAELARRKKP